MSRALYSLVSQFFQALPGRGAARIAGMASPAFDKEIFFFGPYKIDPREVFLVSKHSFALVNLKPVVPGHVLVSSKRVVPRFTDLSSEEVCDLWLTARNVGEKVEKHFKASSLTLAIQDGPQAGQTVPHVHIHVLPRKASDFEKNDEIYDAIDDKAKAMNDHLNLDKERRDRTMDEMEAEAKDLRALFD
ncbi:bifunctional bis(5'-adenosyl)-triphosphatase/adenylylsulfatase FHIT [Selaginella moellendorffii]|uniref:bifunctional bis(5'-adenosyl)-triphosphatase/adenylylsulfatase FHIT n=1 Tax=Selaginella moellendorffii TaxID=88036 RepID=UPI000D1C2B08|nr:bifunctional bis(5'-adenosyl)-triphosphatase/adenylylsulfatase FHIT [Selaginella moellendorffii]|eukprot:XP_024536731.1 bifunctional bis(5'-adenosyl)-triphosphatase/adenylylsulfatase FHIT [Selaginella moellendorffii]